MKTPQIKTLELLIIKLLQQNSDIDTTAHFAYDRMYRHFSDEDFLHGLEHCLIISKIYSSNFYKHKTARALAMELKIDYKTLLEYRKYYVLLFAKHYLNLSTSPKNILSLLYTELMKESHPDTDESILA